MSLSDEIAREDIAAAGDGPAPASGDTGERAKALVAAAYQLLDEEGLEGLTIRGVLAKTGLSRRAFYERFAGKDDLVLAVFEQALQGAAEYFEREVASRPDPMAQLEYIVVSIAIGQHSSLHTSGGHGNKRGAAMSREHLRLAESRPAELQAALSPLLNLMARIVADGIANGQMREGNPAVLASLVYNLMAATTHAELLAEEMTPASTRPREQLATDIWEFCRRALAA